MIKHNNTAPLSPEARPPITGVGLVQVDIPNIHFPNGIPDHYVILSISATVSIFCNPNMLTDIHDVDTPLSLETNGGGRLIVYQKGTIPNFGEVWYHPDSIANILSLTEVGRVRHVTMDTAKQNAFLVHKADGGVTIFAAHSSGLYLHGHDLL
jgi:hypothetical protein